MRLKVLAQDFTVCKVADFTALDLSAAYTFAAATDEEKSLVCPTERVPALTLSRDDGWRGFRVEGVLDFSLIGILSRLSTLLAEAGIGIFAVSTYNTDYIFTKKRDFAKALAALSGAGYEISE